MGTIFEAITAWDNLWLAYRKAARGKRRTGSAAAFEHQVADRLAVLQSDLRNLVHSMPLPKNMAYPGGKPKWWN